jgi:hypothetical protein
MRPDHVPSAPHFFRPVVRAMVAGIAALGALAALIPAPLQNAADPTRPPNPAKSAWFLVWIQELVSHGTAWMYAVLGLAVLFFALPWLRRGPLEHAAWLQPGERIVGAVVLLLALAVGVLTGVGFFLRGESWRLLAPF